MLNFSALPTPRPPATTMLASASSGRSPAAAGWRAVMRTALGAGAGTSTVTCSPAPGLGWGSTAPGRTVITGTSALTLASTMNAPPKIECTAVPPDLTSTTSDSTPEPIRAASRPPISLPSAVAGSRTAAGPADSTSAASTSTNGVIR